MKMLVFDTSQSTLRVVAGDGSGIKAAESKEALLQHSAELLPAIDRVMRRAGWSAKDIEAIGVGIGPGSFTGIRVGVATAQMLAFAWKVRIAAVSSLEILARSLGEEGLVAAVSDARRGFVYGALYRCSGDRCSDVLEPFLGTPEQFREKTRKARVTAGSFTMTAPATPIKDEALLAAAFARAHEGRAVTAARIKPLYLHPKDCNVTKK